MTTVLKLGGSVVTEKDEPETVDRATLADAADAVADADADELVVIHGGGSFGHPHAAAHGVTDTNGTHDAAGVREIHDAMGALNDAVVEALQDRGVPALPVRPLSVAYRDSDGRTAFPGEPVATMLDEGFVPVTHGDVVVQADKGATILSGDEIVTLLAERLGADRVGVCSTVPGVLDGGEVIDRITDFETVASALGESEATDVTGGMAAKIRALLELETPASVFGPADLRTFLSGGRPGTLVHRER
ncbi:isopentenyl phosphate kinase [Halapricum hydrolyticum]|uniref:Isopentenyl phosphate kinase n=1 Tax=Halapricum hydrolyticum TaxID=2979991 RepID=A0AAE3I9D1_9EURY|nr:isopentenyl phosphate kinase [Halapricum hydrolyticum]MCU4716673.1 isopentenyl phosphate kinase [Halapricum hydrolyticum]MCU4725722.1 isopentenyl phosphate kinase [Halapricum hydrolyticum]